MVASASGGSWKDVRNGALLQTVEAASLGLPFEVWKTRMGRYLSFLIYLLIITLFFSLIILLKERERNRER